MRYLLLIVLALLSGLPVAAEESDIPFLPENLQVITAEFAWGCWRRCTLKQCTIRVKESPSC
jgi:hypothetical protein